ATSRTQYTQARFGGRAATGEERFRIELGRRARATVHDHRRPSALVEEGIELHRAQISCVAHGGADVRPSTPRRQSCCVRSALLRRAALECGEAAAYLRQLLQVRIGIAPHP